MASKISTLINHLEEIDDMLARLKGLSSDFFNTTPDELTWADVEGVGHIKNMLAQVAVQAFNEEK